MRLPNNHNYWKIREGLYPLIQTTTIEEYVFNFDVMWKMEIHMNSGLLLFSDKWNPGFGDLPAPVFAV